MKIRNLAAAAVFALASALGTGAVLAEDLPVVEGEVVKIQESAQKITIKHGVIPNLDMPAGMTMVFKAADPEMIGQVKVGDKIKFTTERVNGQITVMELK